MLENYEEEQYVNSISASKIFRVKIFRKLLGYAHLCYLWTTNIKEFFLILKSIFGIFALSIRYGFADITISSVEPERHLYLLSIPFVKITYILHSEPRSPAMTPVSIYLCNHYLSAKKQILTVSYAMKDAICLQWGIKDEKKIFVKVVYNCVPEYFIGYDRLKSQKKTILTLGHVDERKNPALWLEVAKAVTSLYGEYQFLWLGNGPLLDKFKTSTANYTKIKFLGFTANTQKYLETAMIYYQPSLIEPHGIAVLEAMSHSLPCIVTKSGGLPESVKNEYNGIIVDPNDVDEHIRAFVQLLDSEELRILYGSNSLKRFEAKFTYKEFTKKMNEIYCIE